MSSSNITKWCLVCLSLLAVLFGAAAGGRAQLGAVLEGVITDAFGKQIPGTALNLYSPDRVLQTTANQKGQFEFINVPPGTYELEATTPGFVTKTIDSIQIVRNAGVPLAITLAVANNDCSSGATISYENNATGRGSLTGIALASKGPLPNGTLSLTKMFGTQGEISQSANEKGEFLFTDLEAGPYRLKVSHPGYNDEQTQRFWVARENQTKVVVQVIREGLMRVCQ